MRNVFFLLLLLPSISRAQTNTLSNVWVPDLGNGTYKNPVLYADYSDPDAIRVGEDYYLVSSSFNSVPGLQILHPEELLSVVFSEQQPTERFQKPQHGGGVWAPALRYHKGLYYIYYPDPDLGIFVTHARYPTLEGPKFYKRNGYYYIFAPGGGVAPGWQVVMRSKNVFGPYEDRIVLVQGNTPVNGPHQGAWVDTNTGQDWFLHFQDQGAYGRAVHLQPLRWQNDWPIIGDDPDGTGQPVLTHKKPAIKGKAQPLATPATSPCVATPMSSRPKPLPPRWLRYPPAAWMWIGFGWSRVIGRVGNSPKRKKVLHQPMQGLF